MVVSEATPATEAVWTTALRRRRAGIARAHAAEEAAIVGAYRDGVTPTVIAAALGVRNRRRIYEVLTAAGVYTPEAGP